MRVYRAFSSSPIESSMELFKELPGEIFSEVILTLKVKDEFILKIDFCFVF